LLSNISAAFLALNQEEQRQKTAATQHSSIASKITLDYHNDSF